MSSTHHLPLRFLYAIPLRGVTVAHLEDRVRIVYSAGQPGDVVLRSNMEGDIALPATRLARIDLELEHDGSVPLELRLRIRGSGWLCSHTELTQRVVIPPQGSAVATLDTREFRLCQNEPLADHLRLDWKAEASGTLVLRGITLHEQLCEEFFAPRVDRYGQRMAGEWTGKVRNDADLRADAELPVPAPMGDRDAYGGWTGGPRFAATGFFRVERDNQSWWLVTPEGHPFLSFGPTCVSVGTAPAPVAGAEELFAELPAKEGLFLDAWTGSTDRQFVDSHLHPARAYGVEHGNIVNFYIANLIRKYGKRWRERWEETTAARLRHGGMNTLACWSDLEFARRARIPYLIPADLLCRLDFTGLMGNGAAPFPLGQTPDVFHPDFEKRTASAFAELEAFRDDPCLLGYFVQNEEQWGAWQSPFALPLGWESRRVFFAELRTKYGTIDRLNAAWGTGFRDFAHIEQFRREANPPGLLPPGVADCDDFMRRFADRYFRRIRERLQASDPHHLFWGCRFLAAPPRQAVLDGICPHVDLVSINWYMWHKQSVADIPAFLGNWYQAVKRPLVISEYSFSLTNERLLSGNWLRPNAQDRAAISKAFTEGCLALPFVVGCHWFQYMDEAITGRWDGERSCLGIVDVADRPYPELVAALRAAGETMYPRHAQEERS